MLKKSLKQEGLTTAKKSASPKRKSAWAGTCTSKETFLIQLTREQCRVARGLLNWPQARLGAKSNVSEGTVREFENGKRIPGLDKLTAIQSALEVAGVTFLGDGETAEGGPGVRLRKPKVRAAIRDGEAGIIDNSEM